MGRRVSNSFFSFCMVAPTPFALFSQNNQLTDLQITNLLGEGGFAKVFRGLWRGLTVGIKVREGRSDRGLSIGMSVNR